MLEKPQETAGSSLALFGGSPVREKTLPYGRQSINEQDIQAVTDVLRSDWLTTGPKVTEFESELARVGGVPHAVALSNGTAALHTAYHAAGIGPGDEVIVPAISFVATANAAVFLGAKPVFADVHADTLLLNPDALLSKINSKTKAIVSVDYAGQPGHFSELRSIAEKNGLVLISDSCHSLGASYQNRPVGSLADLTVFSFHPVKTLTTGEGGAVLTHKKEFAERARQFRGHGITSDYRARENIRTWKYSMDDLGFNYRIPDLLCALGISQIKRLDYWKEKRQWLSEEYEKRLSSLPFLRTLKQHPDRTHSHHLFVVRLKLDELTVGRDKFFEAMRAEGIGVNVHYEPIYRHPFYQKTFGPELGTCPVAETVFKEILTLPLFAEMTSKDLEDVLVALKKVGTAFSKKEK